MADPKTQEQTEETQPEGTEAEPQQPQDGAETPPPEEAQAKDGEGEEPAAEKPEGEEPTAEQTAKAEEKRKRAGGWERKNQRLERELAELRALVTANKPADPPKPKTAEDQVAEFIRAEVEKGLAAKEAERAHREAQASLQAQLQAAQAKHPDFEDVMESVAHIPVPAAVNEALLTSPHAAEIMYQLAANPAELARISALPPLAAAREIGRLEAKAASTTAAPSKPVRSATRPPAPPTSVNGSGTPATRSLDDLPISDYKRAFRSGRR